MVLPYLICLVGAWQWIVNLGARPIFQDASLLGPTAPIGWAGFEKIYQNALDRNDKLWCVVLSMELVIDVGTFYLPCGCLAMDWQAWGMTCTSGCIPFLPDSAY